MTRYEKFSEYIKENFPKKFIKLNFKKVDERLYYIYRVTDLINHSYYYGSRVSNRFDILDGYYTSSKMNKTIKENPNNYKAKIIKCFDNSGDKIMYEAFLHSLFNVKNHSKFWNKANQTPFGFDTTGIPSHGGKHTEETKQLISSINKGVSWEEKVGKERADKLKDNLKKRNSLRNGVNHPLYGKPNIFKKHSDESRQKMSNFRKGKTYEEIYGKKGLEFKNNRMGSGNPAAKSISLFNMLNEKIGKFETVKEFHQFCVENNYPTGFFKKGTKLLKQVYKPAKNSPKHFRKFEGWFIIIS